VFTIWYVILGRRPESEIAFPKMRPQDSDAPASDESGATVESTESTESADESGAAETSDSTVEPAPDAS